MSNRMAKMFRTSGTGAQQQTLDTTDEKIKIYADDTALDTDLTNIPDGEIVATKESASGGGSGYVGEIPLGTWASFENDTAPNSEWIQAGTTFDANAYPALAMMLGGNTVPERFDHNRLGDIESAPASGFTADYDGVLYGSRRNNGIAVSINNAEVMYSEVTGELSAYFPWTVAFKKGDYITYQSGSGSSHLANIAYFEHPLFIKATPTSNDSDYEGTLNSIREFYVRNNTYSTEERLTGGVWIDGKPIYRKTYYSATNWANGAVVDTVPNVDMVITIKQIASDGSSYREFYTDASNGIGVGYFIATNQIRAYRSGSFATTRPSLIIFEYTKTTD